MTIHELPRPTVPDMQAIDDEALEVFLETLALVHHVDKPLLQATVNNLIATKSTLALAIRVNAPDPWRDFER